MSDRVASRPHPLDGCVLRIRRAGLYIEEARALIRQFESQCEDLVVANSATKAGFGFPEVPADLPLAVSDAAHNLRAALDYLVYELALRDSGSIQNGTQFPIESCKSGKAPGGSDVGFDAVVNRLLKGVSQSNRDAIERLQPYNGAHWARNLKEISNPDKHRHLIGIEKGKTIDLWIRGPGAGGKELPNGDKVSVDANHTIFIKLKSGEVSVTQTLYEIQAAAMDAVNGFRAAFNP